MSRLRLPIVVAGTVLAGTAAASAQTPPTQLDRIEQKLDLILHRLDQLQPDQTAGALATPRPSAPGPVAPPGAGVAAGSSASETLAAGAVAIIHAAPTTPLAAHEIPADSIGGFIYTGGALQLADLKDRGVHYAGLTGVEWQGWLRASESGRYEFELDGSTVSARNFTSSTCVFAGWLEDRSIGVEETTPNSGIDRPAEFSLVLGTALAPGLYKLRFWAVCTPSMPDQRVSVTLLEKAPADLNLRPITDKDLAHKQAIDRSAG